jgi:hypothetical protein
MIVKTKRGYYVYSGITAIGRRKRVGGPYSTYLVAKKVNNQTKSKRKKPRK